MIREFKLGQPTDTDLHVDVPLTEISIAYRNSKYIADLLFPIVPVKNRSNIIPKYDQSHWFRDAATRRAPGSKSQGGGYSVDLTSKYYCDRFSFRKEIADEERDNTDQPFDLDRDGAIFVTDKMQMRREVAFATDFFTTGQWGTDKLGTTDFVKWSDYANSSPLVDVVTFKDVVEALIANEPNAFIIGKQVWVQLKWHPDLIDTIKYTQRAQLSEDLVASLLELDNLYVGRGIYTTSAEGTAEASVTYTRIWGKNALMLYVPTSPSLLTPAAGYTFVWRRVPNADQWIKRMRDEERETDIIEGNTYFDQAITAKNGGLFMSAAVA